MPVRTRWRNMGATGQIALVATIAMLLVAAISLGGFAYGRSGCVSNQLLARNDTSVANLDATDAYSAAQLAFIQRQLKVTDPVQAHAAFAKLGAETRRWHDAVHAARIAAEKHPLGTC